MKRAIGIFACSLLLVAPGAVARAADAKDAKLHEPIETTEKIKGKATVEAIDYGSRTIALKGPQGNVVELEVGPAVTRFSEIKVGDVLNAEYYESTIIELHKAGTKKMEASMSSAVVPTEGKKPAGVATQQETVTVTINSIDLAIPAVTVTTPDGQHASFHVKKKEYLKNLAAGDHVVITRTQGLLVQVESPK